MSGTSNDRIYELDPKGNVTFVVADAPYASFLLGLCDKSDKGQSARNADHTNAADETVAHTTEFMARACLRIRKSSKRLLLASSQFRRTFRHNFLEGNTLRSAGQVEIPVEDGKAIHFLLLIILHRQIRFVPGRLAFHQLVEMAMLVGYYECYEVVERLSDRWISDNEVNDLLTRDPTSLPELLCISWVFQKSDIFKLVTKASPAPKQLQSHSKKATNPLKNNRCYRSFKTKMYLQGHRRPS
ncbi:hypothetical protein BDV29DRAFT_158677 [Aspergillus leporis]|uniref:BTB domain-containing protein n=1 Tax=Aspergillus leporis TaxID=41062 RepID=A0A5N5WUQ5_9EURO|nr:hypothetical protein BDV29DRAFT_158677 [Aspergillus leporis]